MNFKEAMRRLNDSTKGPRPGRSRENRLEQEARDAAVAEGINATMRKRYFAGKDWT